MASYAGHVDVLTRFRVAGWAAEGTKTTAISISIDDELVARLFPKDLRDDVAASGFARQSGFVFDFPNVLSETNVVSLTFDDGSHLARSPNRDHSIRFRNLTDGLTRNELGLEIGALDKPTLLKRDWNVRYVDHASTSDLMQKYGERPNDIDRASLVNVDLVWNASKKLSDVTSSKYDYCLASHVIEHVPDMVSWLMEISDILKTGGKVNLAIPEKTRTFDVRRKLTGAAELVDDYFRRLAKHSPKHIFDHLVYTAPAEDEGSVAYKAIEFIKAKADDYVDVHCHVFTASSFVQNMSVLARSGLMNLSLRKLFPLVTGGNEFIVSLQKLNLSPPEIARSYENALMSLADARAPHDL